MDSTERVLFGMLHVTAEALGFAAKALLAAGLGVPVYQVYHWLRYADWLPLTPVGLFALLPISVAKPCVELLEGGIEKLESWKGFQQIVLYLLTKSPLSLDFLALSFCLCLLWLWLDEFVYKRRGY